MPDASFASSKAGLFVSIYRSGLWRFFPFILVLIIGIAILYPILPSIVTNSFASEASGFEINCEDFIPATAPKACQEAHATAVAWGSWTSFVSGSILSFLFSPITGHLSDHWGRKPFMVWGMILTMLPMVAIMLRIWGWISIYWYYPATALGGIVSAFTISLTSVADLMRQEHRAASVAFIMAMFSIGIIVGPIIGAFMDPPTAAYSCIGLTFLSLVYLVLFLPETAPRRRKNDEGAEGVVSGEGAYAVALDVESGVGEESKAYHGEEESPSKSKERINGFQDGFKAEDQKSKQEPLGNAGKGFISVDETAQEPTSTDSASSLEEPLLGSKESESPTSPRYGKYGKGIANSSSAQNGAAEPPQGFWQGLANGWHVLLHSSWYLRLAIIWALVCAMSNGAQGTLMQYLQLQLGFTTPDQAEVLVVASIFSLAVKMTVLGLLIRYVGDQWMLFLGLFAYVVEYITLAAATSKAMVLGAIGLGSLSAVVWPAVIALQSSRANPQEWGAVAGALQAIGSLASGTGPLLFSAVFSACSVDALAAPYHCTPEAVWYLAAALGGAATLLTGTLHLGDVSAEPPRQSVDMHQQQTPEALLYSAKPRRVDSWVMSRAVSFRSTQDRLGSFFTRARKASS